MLRRMLFILKSLGPIDHKFHGQGVNDGFVLYGYIIKQCSSFFAYIYKHQKVRLVYG